MAKEGIFKIWLVDAGARSDDYWGEGTMYAVGCYLRDYFNEVCNHSSSPFASAAFSWSGNAGVVASHELVVYFLAGFKRSIVRKFYPGVGIAGGNTFGSPAGMISEVYLSEQEGDRNYPRLVANLAFHELLHNKLDAEANSAIPSVHALNTGLSVVPVLRDARPAQKEIELMATNLRRQVPQYTAEM